jgi:hypothetical protein
MANFQAFMARCEREAKAQGASSSSSDEEESGR